MLFRSEGSARAQCGQPDPLSSLFGRAFHVLQQDFLQHAVESLPMIGEISVVICNSGVPTAPTVGPYHELRELCASAARKLHARSLRLVELPDLKLPLHHLYYSPNGRLYATCLDPKSSLNEVNLSRNASGAAVIKGVKSLRSEEHTSELQSL